MSMLEVPIDIPADKFEEKIPSLKGKQKKLKILRTSKDRFILR